MNTQTHLLVIDPQNDFCDPRGALSVPGAADDMNRLADFVTRHGEALSHIHVTLDSHRELDVAHPLFWRDPNGAAPAPFTTITLADLQSGAWRPADPAWTARAESYVAALAENGRYDLTIWPPHCIIGSWGHSIYPAVSDALRDWERRKLAVVNTVHKGTNIWTEHYSAVKAEVIDPEDPGTHHNTALMNLLTNPQVDRIYIAGEALSHCVANTIRDIAAAVEPADIPKLTLITDCTSSVPGFENLGDQFLEEMRNKGMQVANT